MLNFEVDKDTINELGKNPKSVVTHENFKDIKVGDFIEISCKDLKVNFQVFMKLGQTVAIQ